MTGAQVFSWVKLFAPVILSQIPKLAHVADNAQEALEAAEQLKNATGADKKKHYLAIVKTAAEAAKESKPEFSVEEVVAAADAAAETIFHGAKAVQSVHSPSPVVSAPTQ